MQKDTDRVTFLSQDGNIFRRLINASCAGFCRAVPRNSKARYRLRIEPRLSLVDDARHERQMIGTPQIETDIGQTRLLPQGARLAERSGVVYACYCLKYSTKGRCCQANVEAGIVRWLVEIGLEVE